MHPITLSSGRLELSLNPSIGGSISAFHWQENGRAAAILRACNSGSQNVLDAASFPLVPFVNRIRGGRFAFRGRTVRLAPNMAGDPSPLHGEGWLHSWEVERVDERGTTLVYRHEPGEWPWAYEARQEFALDEGGLSLRLTCTNRSSEPMPCGLGQHPYFNCGPKTRIDTRVTHVWTIDEHVLPVEKVPATGRFALANRPVCGQGLDHGFGGWSGEALLTDADWPFEVGLSSPQAEFFQLFSPPDGNIFVAEPVSHANAALNEPEKRWRELGLRVLEPGDAMSLDLRLDVTSA